jgi:hypothetical protein
MAVLAPAPAALLATWGVLVVVLLTEPIRPYTAGVWANADLLSLAIVGGLIGLIGRPLAAATGIALGVAAAVAIQLFVLAGQAVYQPVVVAALDGWTWTASVAGAIVVGAVAMALGYALVRAALALRGIIRRRGPSAIASSATSPPTPMPIAIGVVALVTMGVAVIVLIGGSMLATAQSAYVPSQDETTVHVAVRADGTITSTATTVPVGRISVIIDGPESAQTEALSLVGPLSSSQLALLDRKVLPIDAGCCYWNYRVPRTELPSVGIYAVVAVVHTEPPADPDAFDAWIHAQPISAVRTLTVTAAPARAVPSTEAGGDGGRHLTLPVVAAIAVQGWAAGGVVVTARRRRRPLGRGAVVLAVATGLLFAFGVAVLALLAVNQAHSPF